MTRTRQRPTASQHLTGTLAVAAMLLTACGASTSPVHPRRAAASSSAAIGPQDGSPAPTTSGPLAAVDMPAPAALGAGWKHYVSTGNPDNEGFTPNGSWVWGRSPAQAALELLPIGCHRPLASVIPPEPTAALSANYVRPDHRRAYATVFQFAEPAQAKRFVVDFATIERSCGAPATSGFTTTDGSTFTAQVRLNAVTRTASDVRYTSGLVMDQTITARGSRVTFIGVPRG